MLRYFIFSLTVVATLLFTGCAKPQTYATAHDYQQKLKSKKKVVIVPPMINMYEISNAGEELMDEWSNTARKNMQNSLKDFFDQNILASYSILDINSLTNEQNQIVKDSNNLMYRVSPSIMSHALNQSFFKFEDKIKNFDYTLGNEVAQIGKTDDILLFINGIDRVQTGDKIAVETVKAIVGAFFGIAAGNFGGETFTTVSLVDGKTGNILWYNYYFSKGTDDLRESLGTDNVVQGLLSELPQI